jgi:hypothetical protein
MILKAVYIQPMRIKPIEVLESGYVYGFLFQWF